MEAPSCSRVSVLYVALPSFGSWTTFRKVSLYFFQTYHGQRYDASQDNLFQDPDVRIDLDFDTNRGINLGKARNLLGVEKLSVRPRRNV
jgi:hypothetical protein